MSDGQDYSQVQSVVVTRNLYIPTPPGQAHLLECGVCFALVYADRLKAHSRQLHPRIDPMVVPQ